MLGRHPIDVMLLATDLEWPAASTKTPSAWKCWWPTSSSSPWLWGDSRLVITHSTTGTAEQVTKASWRVDDLAGEIAELQARGVQIQDLPELGTSNAAWITDPTTTGSACSNSTTPPSHPPTPPPHHTRQPPHTPKTNTNTTLRPEWLGP